MALSTVSAMLKRVGLGKRSRLEPPEPPNRYERSARGAGPRRHQEARPLGKARTSALGRAPGRIGEAAGWEYVHVCVDDHSRLAYVEVLADEHGADRIGFLRRAIAGSGPRRRGASA